MLGSQLRSSTNVPSCYCYALRVLCAALKKEERGKKKRERDAICTGLQQGKSLSQYENTGMDINTPTYVNIYTYLGFYLPTYIFIHTYRPYVYLYTHLNSCIYMHPYRVYLIYTRVYNNRYMCTHIHPHICISCKIISGIYTHKKISVIQTLVLIRDEIFKVNGHNHRPTIS